jgi:hypothetical protein
MFQKMFKRTNIEIVLGGNDCSKKHIKEPKMKSVVRRRRWNERSVRRRGHAKIRLLMKKRGQESLQGLVMHKRRMRHITRREKGPCFLSDLAMRLVKLYVWTIRWYFVCQILYDVAMLETILCHYVC